MALSLKDHYRAWRYRYKLDREEIRFLLQSINEGDCVIDVGAHKGAYTYWMQRQCGVNGTCYAFEPQPQLFNKLSRIYADRPHVLVYPLGVSESTGKQKLHVPDAQSATADSPGATLEDHPDEGHKHTIDTTTLSDFFQYKPRLAFIKIDVEGHELAVLRGASSLLQRDRPKLLIECEARHIDHSIFDVFLYLEQLGYEGFFYHRGQQIGLADFDINIHQLQGEGRYWMHRDYVNNFMFV